MRLPIGGYTSADPSASEGERFFAGLNALGRLLVVGSEWASYASMVPGRGGARAALREAGEEAGKKLAKQGAKRAARELPPVVIGENMKGRVVPYARRYGYQTIEDFIPERVWQEAFVQGKEAALALNRR